jgi:AraC-like DNA-binding protein
MTPSTFATKSLPPLDQLQAWQEWFSPVFDIYRTGDIGAEFHARNRVWSAGDILISRVSAPSVRVTRTKDNIAKAPIDHWVLTYCREGATAVRTPRGEFNAAGGVPFLWSIGEEFESERTRVDRIQILLSRDSFSDLAPLLDASRGSAIETPWGSLLGDYMTAVERWLPSMEASDMPRLAQTLRNMIAACIAPSAEHSILAREEIEGSLLKRVRRTVQTHLQSPKLQPAMLCQVLGISRSQLYRLFERAGGVVRYIQRQRLLRIHALLSDPANQRPIVAIARDFCFEDASGFSRAFRKEFGFNASDVRSAAMAGIPLTLAVQTELEAEAVRFADLFGDS